VFDLSENKRLHSIEGHAMAVRSLTFSPDSSILVSASDDTHVKMYDV
jgi:WD repeat-containing protein 61